MFIEDNDLELNIDDLFKDIDEDAQQTTSEEPQRETTKAVSERINEVRRKTEMETQERIAKDLGFSSYSDMVKDKERKLFEDAGVEDEKIEELVATMVEKRFKEDPRFKKLEQYEEAEKNKFVNDQLKAISDLTGERYTSVDQLPKDTLELWEKTGNLKQAFLATQGEELLKKQSKSVTSLSHLADPGNTSNTKTRGLTAEEKAIYRMVLGDDISEEELNKKTKTI